MKKYFVTMLMVIGISNVLNAQTVILNENMTHDDHDAIVTFEVDTDDTNLPHQRKEVILPYIYNQKDTVYLDVVEVYGKGRFKRERQENAVKGYKHWDLTVGQVLKNDGIYEYECHVPLKRWMKSATLGIRRQIIGCACEGDMTDENIAQASLFEEPTVQRRVPEYVVDDVRQWDFGRELEIAFKVSKSEIDSSVFDNEITFGLILEAVDKIFVDPIYKLDVIEVAGYASPEGPSAFNKKLGKDRANALINYIINQRPQYGLTMDNFRIVNGEENWPGLRKALLETEMDHKAEVIAIIDDASLTGEQKKLKIRAIENGNVWKKMLKEIYPHLRSARYLAVFYESADDETTEIIEAANVRINEGSYEEAEKMVRLVENDPRAYNTVGVAIMMQGRFEEALPWLQKAAEIGSQAAKTNIHTLYMELEWEAQRQKEIEEYLKQYE